MEIAKLHQLFLASNGVSTDTRNLKKNTLFFALKGQNFNGNDFALNAINKGCTYAIIDEGEGDLKKGLIRVNNVLETLQKLANFHRKTFNFPIIGITGSNGKTTSKELLGAVLSTKYRLLMTAGNLNNHIGVPLTILQLNNEHEMAIIEMGANKIGDIQELVEIAEPTHGMITNIGSAHLEGFGSIEGVLKGKTELFRYLSSSKGHVFYNTGDLKLKSALPNNCSVTGFGIDAAHNEVKGNLVNQDPFVNFTYTVADFKSELIKTKLVGRYNFNNFIATIAIGYFFGVDFIDMNKAIAAYQPSNNRSQITRTKNNVLVVDCYNANPTSVSAAIKSFSEIEHKDKFLILGDMLELGDYAIKEHQNCIDLLNELGLRAILVGKYFCQSNSNFVCFDTVNDVIESDVLQNLKDKLILLKGSRGVKLESLIEFL